MKDGDKQALAYALHGFIQERPDWPHSSVRPRVQPHNCWPCWNGADHIARVLDGMAVTFKWNSDPADAIDRAFRVDVEEREAL